MVLTLTLMIQLSVMYVPLNALWKFQCVQIYLQPHSEVPEKDEDWPTLENILDFRDRYAEIASSGITHASFSSKSSTTSSHDIFRCEVGKARS